MPVVRITDLSWGGEGIGRIEGKVVFVPFSLRGEVVEVEVVRSKRNFSQGKLVRILEPSPDRIEPPCPFYGDCGGCQLQHLAPSRQIQEKERLFKQALNHALKPADILVLPTLPSSAGFGYRHRLQVKAFIENNHFNLGFFKPKSHQLVPVNHCLLANRALNQVMEALRGKIQVPHFKSWSPEIELQVFDNPQKGGMVFRSPYKIPSQQQERIIQELREIPGLNYILFQDLYSQAESAGPHSLPEKDTPEFSLPLTQTGLSQDIRLSCFPGVFTQVNLEMNRRLIRRLVDLNLFSRREFVLDLYCGLGNFSLPLALRAEEVIGLEAFPQAVENARRNQMINRISNCTFIQGKAEDAYRLLKKLAKPVSWVILDPPRTGAREVVPIFDAWNLKGILYISCDPMTLGRDLARLTAKGWKVQWSQPLDFFPQTFHLESITLLIK